jgi:threonylcarbamoyladenosine tRNA methylthiotransferase MtaB
VVAQVRRLAAQGYQEVVLTGVDVTSWGADLPGQPTLGQLVARILKLVPELPRLRLSSIDAAEIDADLLRCLAEEPRLMPYLHLSLQAGDDMILKRHEAPPQPRRRPEAGGRGARCAPGHGVRRRLHRRLPDRDRRDVRQHDPAGGGGGPLAFLHVFPFSARPGTPAARMPAVSGAVVKARARGCARRARRRSAGTWSARRDAR